MKILKTIFIAIILYAISIAVSTLIIQYIYPIPLQVAFALESSFFLTYLYGQFVISNSLRKGVQLNKSQKIKIYSFVWIIITVVMIVINYLIY